MQRFARIAFSIFKFIVNVILSIIVILAGSDIAVILSRQPYGSEAMVIFALPVLAIAFIIFNQIFSKFKERYWLTLLIVTTVVVGSAYLLSLWAHQYGYGV